MVAAVPDCTLPARIPCPHPVCGADGADQPDELHPAGIGLQGSLSAAFPGIVPEHSGLWISPCRDRKPQTVIFPLLEQQGPSEALIHETTSWLQWQIGKHPATCPAPELRVSSFQQKVLRMQGPGHALRE